MYLLDTNVVFEFRRIRPHGAVIAWIKARQHLGQFVAAVTLAEIQRGIEVTRSQDAAKAAEIESWLGRLENEYNVLPMTGNDFRLWARLMVRKTAGLTEDAMIAAMAKNRDFTVVTRNVNDFKSFDVAVINPFDPA